MALLELALYRFALDRLVGKGFVPVLPPVLVREEAMYGTGFLPTDEVNIYKIERDELYLTGTSEVALASFHMGEELDELPRRYAGYSTNFRRESGAAGKDTRGMFRVHQFDKVEMFVFTEPGSSARSTKRCSRSRRSSSQEVGLPYRVVNVAAGDLGASAAKKYDIEAWFPSQQRYREITSTSNTTDYQARRLGHPLPARREARAGAHAERHRDDGPLADRAARELPGRRRRDRRARGPDAVRRSAYAGLDRRGVPERTNGAVLKTAGGRKVTRGFESHPRRLVEPEAACSEE